MQKNKIASRRMLCDTPSRRVFFLSVFFFLIGLQIPTHAQQVSTSWNGGTGNWSGSANWNPSAVPNNNATTTYSVAVNVPSSVVTMDVLNDTIDNLNLGTSASLTIVGGNSLNLVLGQSSNYGTINNGIPDVVSSAGGTLTNSGTLYNYGTFNNGVISSNGSMLTNSGTLYNYGLLNSVYLSGVSNSGTIYNTAGATLIYSADCICSNAGYISNAGTFVQAGGLGTLSSSGTIDNTGSISIGRAFINTGTLNNSGSLNAVSVDFLKNDGRLSDTGTITSSIYTQDGGSTIVDGKLTVLPLGDLAGYGEVYIDDGMLSGTGTISGNVLMGGILMPGDAPGTLTVLGDYEQTGAGIFDEIISGKSQSFLDVSGIVTLDPGSLLEITLLNGYDPLHQTFSIMDFASLNGQFANGASFWDDGFLWDITYRQHEVEVTAVEAPEPSSLLLLFFGLAAVAFLAHRKIEKSRRLA